VIVGVLVTSSPSAATAATVGSEAKGQIESLSANRAIALRAASVLES
jgi:hypothetical protein